MVVNILGADGNCSLLNRDNSRQPIQMLLSQQQKTFSKFVSGFFKAKLNFQHFQEKGDPHS